MLEICCSWPSEKQQAWINRKSGDRRPRQLVAEINWLFPEIGLTADDTIIKSRLLSAFPPCLRSAYVGHDESPLNQYAKIADSMLAVWAKDTPFKIGAVASKDPEVSADRSQIRLWQLQQ